MEDLSAHVAVLYVSLFIGDSESLKDKRMVIKRLKDKVRSQFNVSIAELDGHEKWQVCTLGFAMIGVDDRYIEETLQNIFSLIHSYHAVEICDHEITFYS